jgi:outer membrane protein TolC
LQARAALANAQTQRIERTGQVEVATLHLTQVVGQPIDGRRGLGEELVGFEVAATPELAEVLGNARVQRPELNALRVLADARIDFAKARRGARWPQVRAFGNVLTAQPNPRIFPQQEEFNTTWEAGLALSWSPNDAVFAHTQAKDAEVDLALARQDLILAENGVAIEVTSAITSHRTAREEVTARRQGMDAARRRYQDQSALMKAGAATPDDVLESETELRQAELGFISAYIHVREAEAALLKAQGQTGVSQSSGSRE